MSVIAALSLVGVFAPMMLEGSFDSAAFALYVEHMLVPELLSGDIVIMDNVPFHKNDRAHPLIAAAGAEVTAVARLFAGYESDRAMHLEDQSGVA